MREVSDFISFLQLIPLVQELKTPRRYSPERLQALQTKRLRKLLAHAGQNSPFYQKRFLGHDLGTCRLADLPTVTKADMMENFDDLVTDRSITRTGVERFIAEPSNLGTFYLNRFAICHTSGSQGQPVLIVQEPRAMMTNFVAQITRGMKLSNERTPHLDRLLNPARVAILTQRPGFYPSAAAFSYLPKILRPFINILRLSVFDPVADNVAKLNDYGPEFLTGYSSSLEVLAREEEQGRLKLQASGRLKQINNISEPLPEATRQRIRSAFGANVYDQYAMGECMALSSGCPAGGGSHINSDLSILEVVDKNNNPVPAGQPGSKVLLTNLYNLAQPFIRYEIDDIVTMSTETGVCSCKSSFPKIKSIEGRGKDKFWIDDCGTIRDLPAYLFLTGMHHCLELSEHQVLQTGVNKFVIRASPQPGKILSKDRLRYLVGQSIDAEGLTGLLQYDVELVDQIPRGPSGKVARSQNLYGPPPAGPAAASIRLSARNSVNGSG